MRLRYKVTINFPAWMKEGKAPPERLQAMAQAREMQVVAHLRTGGVGSTKFPLNSEGRTPLGAGSGPIPETLHSYVDGQNFGVESDFIGANLLINGTTGKGGTRPPVTPKKAKLLAFTVGGILRFAKSVEIPPRNFLLMDRNDRLQLAAILFGKRPEELNII